MLSQSYKRRDLSAEDSLVDRDYDEELELRELDRRFLGQIMANYKKRKADRLRNELNRVQASQGGTSAMSSSMSSSSMGMDPALAMRALEDVEYDQRDLTDAEEDLAARDYVDEEDLTARDYDEELEMRDSDEDGLVARDTNLFDTLSAVARTFNPSDKAAAPVQEARDVLEGFDARDFEEIDELD